jgi:hypothetical protein
MIDSMDLERCDICGRPRKDAGRIFSMVNRKRKKVAACTKCLEFVIDTLVTLVEKRRDIPKRWIPLPSANQEGTTNGENHEEKTTGTKA